MTVIDDELRKLFPYLWDGAVRTEDSNGVISQTINSKAFEQNLSKFFKDHFVKRIKPYAAKESRAAYISGYERGFYDAKNGADKPVINKGAK